MITEPKLEYRDEQPYMAIRSQVPMRKLSEVIPQSIDEVAVWLGKQGVAPAGPPFVRYLVINMAANLDIEIGFPVAQALADDGRVKAGVIPAGNYASLIYTDVTKGIPANAALLDWGAQYGLVWDSWADEQGDGFGGRVESFLTGPADNPDSTTWETEVAIRVADNSTKAA